MLPGVVRKSLQAVAMNNAEPRQETVSRVLSDAIASVDGAIVTEFLRMFPGGEGFVRNLDSAAARAFINDRAGGGSRYAAASRMLGGSTALLTLFEENTGRLWVANLGDSCAGIPRSSSVIDLRAILADRLLDLQFSVTSAKVAGLDN